VTPVASKPCWLRENPAVTASFRPEAVVGAALAAVLAAGCGDFPPPAPASAGSVQRTGPDDGDAWNLVPATATSLADLDLSALRASPWSSSLVTGGFVEDREARLRDFGYDVFNDADRMVVAAVDVAGQSKQVTIVIGRLDVGRVSSAFVAATPGAAETRWRDCRVWEAANKRSMAVVGRTLVQGTPDTVRAAIDTAWGVLPDARSGPLGALARDLGADTHRPAALLALVVTDDVRARAREILEVPPGLGRVGGRLDLRADLELTAQALFDDPSHARAAARTWQAALAELRSNRVMQVMGLSPIVEGASLTSEGARVHGRLRVPESKRDVLSERVLLLLQTVARQRGEQEGGPQP
jgi:hypothetical protein